MSVALQQRAAFLSSSQVWDIHTIVFDSILSLFVGLSFCRYGLRMDSSGSCLSDKGWSDLVLSLSRQFDWVGD